MMRKNDDEIFKRHVANIVMIFRYNDVITMDKQGRNISLKIHEMFIFS